MDNTRVSITIDTPAPDVLSFTLEAADGTLLDRIEVPYRGPVDNLLLTGIDNLLNKHRLHKFALNAVRHGQGIDKNSSLYRMVQSFATAITAAEKRP
jgi:wyosine [tRNA(Phe)-imidazoG37] synthetase (radical SAM superfamily)